MPHATSQVLSAGTEFADSLPARNAMVDSQVRPNKVTDPRIIAAMRRLPREAFLPASLRAWAYADDDVKLGAGRVMMSPMVSARLLQVAMPLPGERVLLVGSGTGYVAALLAACDAAVTALEEDTALIAIAAPALAVWAPGVAQLHGPLAAGAPGAAPFDLVLVEGGVAALPEAIAAQVAPQGRLVMVRAAGAVGQAVIGRPSAGQLSFAVAFDATVAVLPAFRQAPAFAF